MAARERRGHRARSDTAPETLTPKPLSHPLGEGGVGLSPTEAEREKSFAIFVLFCGD